MHSMALRLASNTAVMSSSTSGLKPHISGWCGSNRKTGGAPIGSPAAGYPIAWASALARSAICAAAG